MLLDQSPHQCNIHWPRPSRMKKVTDKKEKKQIQNKTEIKMIKNKQTTGHNTFLPNLEYV